MNFFSAPLSQIDPEVYAAVELEHARQSSQIELIASENIVSNAVLMAQGSVLTNKYAEGYSGRRYYGGCEMVDKVEDLACARLKQLFNARFVNVQPHSGAQANGAVMLALLQPGDTILGMSLSAGGHLTHGARVSQSGKWFNAVSYGVRPEDQRIDYDQVVELAQTHQPKMLIAGASAYPRTIDFARLRQIADSVGAYFFVDMAHIAGLVACGQHPDPLPHAHVVSSTTHKTLRGPRGGILLTNDEAIAKKLNSAVFPGLQGGPLMHVIAAKAVAFAEALQPEFNDYISAVRRNIKALGDVLQANGLNFVTGGTDNHLLLIDLRPMGLKGNQVESALERAGMTCNKNSIPYDTEKPTITSGIRIGSSAATTRGFTSAEFAQIGEWMVQVFEGLRHAPNGDEQLERRVCQQVAELCQQYPIYTR